MRDKQETPTRRVSGEELVPLLSAAGTGRTNSSFPSRFFGKHFACFVSDADPSSLVGLELHQSCPPEGGAPGSRWTNSPASPLHALLDPPGLSDSGQVQPAIREHGPPARGGTGTRRRGQSYWTPGGGASLPAPDPLSPHSFRQMRDPGGRPLSRSSANGGGEVGGPRVPDRKSTRLNSSHDSASRMPSSA